MLAQVSPMTGKYLLRFLFFCPFFPLADNVEPNMDANDVGEVVVIGKRFLM